MDSIPADLTGADVTDHFDRIPDSLLLLIFNKIGDVKALGRCGVLSRRPLQALGQLLGSKRPLPPPSAVGAALSVVNVDDDGGDQSSVTHHSPTQVLKNFNEIKYLRIDLPSGELGIDDGVLLKWRAHFGSTLDKCVILGASSVVNSNSIQLNDVNSETVAVIGSSNNNNNNNNNNNDDDAVVGDDNGSIPESFYTNGGLKLRVDWTICSLYAASARHYLLQPIIGEHRTLNNLVLTDRDGQGVLCMNKDQLEELRVKPLSASSASKRTLVPAVNMRMWYAPHLELPGGMVLKGATLVAIRPSEQSVGGGGGGSGGGGSGSKEISIRPSEQSVGGGGSGSKEVSDLLWVSTAFEEPYGTAAKMLVKRRAYCFEMSSF
ncbi:hypothetical protein RND81_08G010700 [Saponaria officinalis]|uniref:F-box protein n=1 Tax=Saponaria officinalis TaxID=3572 RepID=A0AAW1J2F9_SAPOF